MINEDYKKRLAKLAGIKLTEGDDGGYQKMLDDHLSRIKSATSTDELEKETIYERLGGMMGFNPTEPFRTAYREKIEELLLKEQNEENIKTLNWWKNCVQGEHVHIPDNKPPGAMY